MTYRANEVIEQLELEQMAIEHMEIKQMAPILGLFLPRLVWGLPKPIHNKEQSLENKVFILRVFHRVLKCQILWIIGQEIKRARIKTE